MRFIFLYIFCQYDLLPTEILVFVIPILFPDFEFLQAKSDSLEALFVVGQPPI